MARTLQPADETVSATRSEVSGDGTTTNTANGGFPTRRGKSVTITVGTATLSTSVDGNAVQDGVTAAATLEYTTDGSTWTTLGTSLSNTIGAPWTDSDTTNGPFSDSAGDVTNLSLIDLRGSVTLTGATGGDLATGTVTVTDWEITYTPVPTGAVWV